MGTTYHNQLYIKYMYTINTINLHYVRDLLCSTSINKIWYLGWCLVMFLCDFLYYRISEDTWIVFFYAINKHEGKNTIFMYDIRHLKKHV